MGRGGAPAREISFVSLVAYSPKVSDSALTMGVTASETRQGSSQQVRTSKIMLNKSVEGVHPCLVQIIWKMTLALSS